MEFHSHFGMFAYFTVHAKPTLIFAFLHRLAFFYIFYSGHLSALRHDGTYLISKNRALLLYQSLCRLT